MTTRAEMEAIVAAEHPYFIDSENGGEVIISPEEFPGWYKELKSNLVTIRLAGEAMETTRSVVVSRRRQFRKAMVKLGENHAALRGNGALTAAAQRTMLADVTQGVLLLGDILRDSGIFSPDDDL